MAFGLSRLKGRSSFVIGRGRGPVKVYQTCIKCVIISAAFCTLLHPLPLFIPPPSSSLSLQYPPYAQHSTVYVVLFFLFILLFCKTVYISPFNCVIISAAAVPSLYIHPAPASIPCPSSVSTSSLSLYIHPQPLTHSQPPHQA